MFVEAIMLTYSTPEDMILRVRLLSKGIEVFSGGGAQQFSRAGPDNTAVIGVPLVDADTMEVELAQCDFSHLLRLWSEGVVYTEPVANWGKPAWSEQLPAWPSDTGRVLTFSLEGSRLWLVPAILGIVGLGVVLARRK